MQIADKSGLKPLNFDKTQRRFIDVAFNRVKPASYSGAFHCHENIELIYCVSGRLKITFSSNEILLKKGDWIFINSYCGHSTNPNSSVNEHYLINLNPEILDVASSSPIPKALHFLKKLPDYIHFPANTSREDIYSLFNKAHENFTQGNFVKRLALQSVIMELMSHIFEEKLPKVISTGKKEKNTTLYTTKEYIDKNYATVNLESAAENASMSYSYFSRIFKNTFNMSFSKYLTKVRVEKSIAFLTDTPLNITEIAMECGFSNLSHFVKCFKEEKGITPNQFRANFE